TARRAGGIERAERTGDERVGRALERRDVVGHAARTSDRFRSVEATTGAIGKPQRRPREAAVVVDAAVLRAGGVTLGETRDVPPDARDLRGVAAARRTRIAHLLLERADVVADRRVHPDAVTDGDARPQRLQLDEG